MKIAIILSIMALSTITFGEDVNCTTNPNHPSCSQPADTSSTTTIIDDTPAPTEEITVDTTEVEVTPTLDTDPSDLSDSSDDSSSSSSSAEGDSF